MEWNGYEARQTPLLYVFVDLTVHRVQWYSYLLDVRELTQRRFGRRTSKGSEGFLFVNSECKLTRLSTVIVFFSNDESHNAVTKVIPKFQIFF